MDSPSRSEIVAKFHQLIQDSLSREKVATWAQKWVIVDKPAHIEQDVWEALKFLTSADLVSTDRPFLYTKQDFERELALFLKL